MVRVLLLCAVAMLLSVQNAHAFFQGVVVGGATGTVGGAFIRGFAAGAGRAIGQAVMGAAINGAISSPGYSAPTTSYNPAPTYQQPTYYQPAYQQSYTPTCWTEYQQVVVGQEQYQEYVGQFVDAYGRVFNRYQNYTRTRYQTYPVQHCR